MQPTTKPAPTQAPTPAATPAKLAPGTITLLVPNQNGKPGGKAVCASATRFALYKNGMTVAAYKAAVKAIGQPYSLAAADLRWDVRHKFISIA
jgi:hypothetical protein